MSDEYCFQSKAERCGEGNTSPLPLFQRKGTKTRSRPSAALCTGIKQPLWGFLPATGVTKGIWQSSCETVFWAVLQMYILEHTHHRGPCLSVLFTPRNKTGTEIPHQARSCGPVPHSSYHSWSTEWLLLARLSTLFSDLCLETFYFDCELQGACSACRKLPKKHAQDL